MDAGSNNAPPRRGMLHWGLLPLRLVWRGVSLIERRLGLLATSAIGITLFVFGILLNTTWIGMPIGIPATLLGSVFLLRALY